MSSDNALSPKEKWLSRLKGYKNIQSQTFVIQDRKVAGSKKNAESTITLLDISLSTDSNYSARSELISVKPNQKYTVSIDAIGIVGKPKNAFFGVSLFDANNDFIGRRVKWLDDFSGESKKYTIVFNSNKASKIRLIYRINVETPVSSYCEYKLLPIETLGILPVDPKTEESFDAYADSDLPVGSQPLAQNVKAAKLADTIKKEVEQAKLAKQLVFPKSETPKVSIIILNYNKGDYTFNCLSSVLRNTKAETYEVILVDNGSTEKESKEILKRLKNVKVLESPENLGFIRGNNYAAKHAAGEYILFLNNDTIVLQGWLDALLKTFDIYDRVGVVGSKFIYPDGTLQEAGSMIWKDGSARGYGRNVDDPSKPEYHFVREVDFCSGASLIVRKDLFMELGMLNEFYAPAYFEDVDLCFGARKKGYKVMFNPFSTVVHYEGVTSTRDPHNPTGVKRFEIINRPKFVSLWKDELKKRLAPFQANILYARDLKKGPPVLIVDGWVPEPDKSSGDLRSYNIVKILSKLGCKVTLYVFHWNDSKYANDLRESGVEVIPSLYVTIEQLLRERPGYYSLAFINSNRMSFANFGDCTRQIKKDGGGIKVALHVDDLYGFCKVIKNALPGDQSNISEDADVEKFLTTHSLDLIKSSDYVFIISEREKSTINSIAKHKKSLIIPEMRRPIPAENIAGFKDRENSILYVGGFSHTPNVDSAKILIYEVFPKVRKKVPDAKLYIIGNVPPPELKELKDTSIIVTGFVEDLSGYYKLGKVAAAPIVAKGGVKGKIVEALNYGTPVVTSPLGIEGTELQDGIDISIGKDNDDFAEKIVVLFKDEKLWQKMVQNGRKYFDTHNSTLQGEEVLGKFLQELDGRSEWLGAADGTMRRLQVEEPLAVLLTVYNERQDLQNHFPEAKNGEYSKLIQWAARYGVVVDSNKDMLAPYKDWFAAKLPQDSK